MGLVLPGMQCVRDTMGGRWLYQNKKMFKDLAAWLPEFHKTGSKLFVQPVSYTHLRGAQGRYAGRAVELRFPWWYLNSAGEIDTGFGLTVRLAGSAELLRCV